jgi:hypothetical protein
MLLNVMERLFGNEALAFFDFAFSLRLLTGDDGSISSVT